MHTVFLLFYRGHPHLGFLRSTKPREPPLFQQSRALDRQIQEQEKIVKMLQKEQAGIKVGLLALANHHGIHYTGDGGLVQKDSKFCRC